MDPTVDSMDKPVGTKAQVGLSSWNDKSDPTATSNNIAIGTKVQVGLSFWGGEIVDGPLEWRRIKHYQVEHHSGGDRYVGWFSENDLNVSHDFDFMSFPDIFDSDSDTGDDGHGGNIQQPPRNGRNYPRHNNGNNGSNNTGGAHPSNHGASFSSSFSSNNGGGRGASSHDVATVSCLKELISEESDQSEDDVVSDDPSDDNKVSDEEQSAAVGDEERDWAQLTTFYANLIMLQVLREGPFACQSAVGSGGAAPTESSCSRNDCEVAEASSSCDDFLGPKVSVVYTVAKPNVRVLGNVDD